MVHILNISFYRCFATVDSEEIRSATKIKWEEIILKLARNCKADDFVMLSYDARTIVIVSNKKEKKNKIISVKNGEPGFGIPKKIWTEMAKHFLPNDFNGVPFYCYTNFLP